MKYFFSISNILIAILLTSNLIGVVSAQSVTAAPLQPKEGEYLSHKYLEVLKRTRSPFLADACTVSKIVVQRNENGTLVTPNYNFHEGGPWFQIDESGNIELKGLDMFHGDMKVGSSGVIRYGNICCLPQDFIHVDKLNELLNHYALAGQYRDRDGGVYVFTDDGHVSTPTRIFEYSVGTDHVPYQFDYFIDLDTHDVYRFVRNGCRLDIFKILNPAIEGLNDGSDSAFGVSLTEIDCQQ